MNDLARACPYTMMKAAREAPVCRRVHPRPRAESRKKYGSATSNHKSRDANKKALASDSLRMLGAGDSSVRSVTSLDRAVLPTAAARPKKPYMMTRR